MLKLDSIRANLEAEQNGEFVAIPKWPGVKLGVRSIRIPAYKIAFEQLAQRLARRYKGQTIPPEVRDSEVGKLLADVILFGWEGIDPAYSADFAKDFMGDASGRELVEQVAWAAEQVGLVDAEFTEDAVKN